MEEARKEIESEAKWIAQVEEGRGEDFVFIIASIIHQDTFPKSIQKAITFIIENLAEQDVPPELWPNPEHTCFNAKLDRLNLAFETNEIANNFKEAITE